MSLILSSIVLILFTGTVVSVHGINEENQEIYERAENLFVQKKYQEALKLYEKILSTDPDHADATGGIAATYFKLGNPLLSLEYFDMALVINSTNPYFLSDKGSVLLSVNQPGQAEQYLKESLSIFPSNTDALNGLANVYSYNQDYENEILYRSSVLVIHPDNQEAMIGIGNAYMGLKKFGDAIEQYNKVLEMNKASINAIIGIGNAYMGLNEHKKSIEQYDQALVINPYNTNALKGKSIAHVNIGEYEKAIKIDGIIQELKQSSIPDKNPGVQDNKRIPPWIKNVFGWYQENKVSENEVLDAIKFLINEKIIVLE